jgi:hypothetical protein
VKRNEYANLLRAGLASPEAAANEWILNTGTAEVRRLLSHLSFP